MEQTSYVILNVGLFTTAFGLSRKPGNSIIKVRLTCETHEHVTAERRKTTTTRRTKNPNPKATHSQKTQSRATEQSEQTGATSTLWPGSRTNTE